MRPKRYPFSGKIKASTTEIVKAFEIDYSKFIDKTQKKQEQAEQELQDVAKSLPIIERYISLRQSFTRKGWEEINSLYDYQLNEKERNLSKDITLNDSETNAFRKYAQMVLGLIYQCRTHQESS